MPEIKKPVEAPKKAEIPAAPKKVETPAITAAQAPKKLDAPKKAPALKAPKAVKKPAVKKAAAPKAVKAAKAEKAARVPKGVSVNVIVEHHGRQIGSDTIVKTAEKLWVKAGHDAAKIASVELYIKQEDGAVYCVVNGEAVGKYDL